MTSLRENRGYAFGIDLWATGAGLAVAVLLMVFATSSQAQTYTILHGFNNYQDGSFPTAGVTIDPAGNLYGTTFFGGSGYDSPGIVFKLSREGSGWIFTKLYSFHGGSDGANPTGRVVFGPQGNLYGNTAAGGLDNFGTVYKLQPPPRACPTVSCPWTVTVIHRFNSYDGFNPQGDVVFDHAGNLYGTTSQGGTHLGTVYELTPSGGSWVETTLNTLAGAGSPSAGVILDQAGNLYGTGYIGDGGTVYELTTPGWNLQILHLFDFSDGSDPFGGLIFGQAGNLYGGALCGGVNGKGTIYELTPSGGSWTLQTLYNFTTGDQNYCGGPYASLTMDAAGNLYGTTHSGGAYESGSVFKLTRSGGGWTYTSLHDFCAGGYPCSDGCYPFSNVTFDSQGNLYGTASGCGPHSDGGFGPGVVWEITP